MVSPLSWDNKVVGNAKNKVNTYIMDPIGGETIIIDIEKVD